MSDSETIELACLGRPFQLGMLYDCRKDFLIPGITLWDSVMLQKNINVHMQPNTEFKIIASDSSKDKAEALNVSASLEASFLCGLVSVKGSADYLHDKKKSKNQSRVTLQYRTTTRFEQLTMEHLGAGNVKHNNVFKEASATHVVTALLYGAQAFFVFDREVLSNESHQDIHGDLHATIKKIPTISIEGQASLTMKELEKDKIDKFSCTFHGDFALENNPVTYLDAIKVYSELPKLLGGKEENAVPMTVWLYPLKKLDSAAAQLVREINVSLVQRAQRILDGLDDCDIQCQDLMRDNVAIQFPEIKAKLKNFKELCSGYKVIFQKRLSRLLPSIRGGGKDEQELSDFLNRNEMCPFQSVLMNKYLKEQEREIIVVGSYLGIMQDIPVLSTSNDLDKIVLKASSDFVVAFALSSLNDKEPYLSDLKNYLIQQSSDEAEQPSYDQSSTESAKKWFTLEDVTTHSRENIQAFIDFKEANKERRNIEFCIVSIPDDLRTASSIHVYEQAKLISSEYELPSKPPMPNFLSATHDCIHLQITPPDHGISRVTSYCISYKSAESSEWTEMYTDSISDQVTVKQLQPHKEYSFTCKAVCHPGVSLASDTTQFFRTLPCAPPGAPTVKSVGSKSVTLTWDIPKSVGEDIMVTEYVLEFRERPKGQETEKPWKSVKSASRDYTFQGLEANTEYTVRVFANCGSDGVSLPSPETVFSACSKIKSPDEAGSGLFLDQSSRIHKGNPSIYKLKLHKKMKENEEFDQYVFGKQVEDMKNKVILLVGATGSGKTTLINVMVNYILGVKWEEAYRFKLIHEETNRTQAESQTSIVSSYELYSQPGFRIPYSLTIIDTPGFGDTRGIDYDKLLTKQLKSFLCSPLGINHIDAVCFVAQASLARLSANQRYIFDSILSIFGKDIGENIMIMVTFADSEEIPVLEAIKAADLPCQKNTKGEPIHFKFNNTAVYADKTVKEPTTSDSDSDEYGEDNANTLSNIVWTSAFKQMKAFFKALGKSENKDLTLTKKVLEERERLEKAIADLIPQITDGLTKRSTINTLKEHLKNERNVMKQTKDFEKDVVVTVPIRSPIDSFALNCTLCSATCHSTCYLPAEDSEKTCAVMDESGCCVICPNKCSYTFHLKEKWTYENKTEKKTIDELKDIFMKAHENTLGSQDMLDILEKELTVIQANLRKLIKLSSDCLNQLNKIALKTGSLSTLEYLEILIKTEKAEKHPGFEDRIVGLEMFKNEIILQEKITKGDDLLTLEEPERQ